MRRVDHAPGSSLTQRSHIVKAEFPAEATALFEDMSAVSYAVVTQQIAPALASGSALDEAHLQSRLITQLKTQYERVAKLAESGK